MRLHWKVAAFLNLYQNQQNGRAAFEIQNWDKVSCSTNERFRQATKLILFSTNVILASNNQFMYVGTDINYSFVVQHK